MDKKISPDEGLDEVGKIKKAIRTLIIIIAIHSTIIGTWIAWESHFADAIIYRNIDPVNFVISSAQLFLGGAIGILGIRMLWHVIIKSLKK